MKLLFIHRSVGQQICNEVRNTKKIPALRLFDLNVNSNLLKDTASKIIRSEISIQNGDTSPEGLANFFQTALTNKKLENELLKYDVIAFKSCYTASAISSNKVLNEYKRAYSSSIEQFIRAHPKLKFVIISPPPRRPLFTSKTSKKLAGDYAVWLSSFSKEISNCYFFDLFETLSDGYLLAKPYRRYAFWDQHPNRLGTQVAADKMIELIKSIN